MAMNDSHAKTDAGRRFMLLLLFNLWRQRTGSDIGVIGVLRYCGCLALAS